MLLVIGYGVYRRISYVIYRIIKLPEKLGLERQDAEHTIYITPEVPDAVLFPGPYLGGIYSNIPGDPIGFSHIWRSSG
mgnify:CR=1 FL=1